ncbi:MAG: PEP-utilizing enzyme [Actinomycetota bacterium]|nr:hypothetical protein [Actinomycetota bacterium]
MSQTAVDLQFDPPGPGTWQIDPLHFPRPVTRYWAEMHPEAFISGASQSTAFYGMLIRTMEMRYVNGFAYGTAHAVDADEFQRRVERAREVFEGKLWRDQLLEWDDKVKPASVAKHRALQAVDPDALSDEELAGYLTRCRDHHAAMITQHMRFTGAATVPIGDLLAHVGEWTGLPPSDLLGMMRGASAVSSGMSAELDRLVAAIKIDPAAQHLIASDDEPGKVIETLSAQDTDAGRALAGYLDVTGCRLLDGFDISGRYALEMPDVLLRAIRSSVEGRKAEDANVDEQVASVRAKVPEEHRATFDELFAEARANYHIRDERGVFSDIWASGLMRRAAMAGGRRLAARGRLHDAEHFIDAGFDEMLALLSGADTPSADELADRYSYRTTHTAKDAPPVLGPPPSPLPDPASLPPAAARMMRAVFTSRTTMFLPSQAPHKGDTIRGLAVSGGVYEGPARRVAGPVDFDRILQGDVLVTESTTEAFNILLPLLGAVVTDSGGLLSHAAIITREYGIPGVVGTRDATDRIPDGVTVRVDGDKGEVTMLA